MKLKTMSPKVESELLLNLKDINKFKSENMDSRMASKKLDIDVSLEKYNQEYIKALDAPVPKINLPYNEVLLRAVPLEIKTKGNLIISAGDADVKIAQKLNLMSDKVSHKQEILMVGGLVSDEEKKNGLRPGMMCKIRLDRFRRLHDSHNPGLIELEYDLPTEIIDGHKYMIVDKRDIVYTYEKQ